MGLVLYFNENHFLKKKLLGIIEWYYLKSAD